MTTPTQQDAALLVVRHPDSATERVMRGARQLEAVVRLCPSPREGTTPP